MNGEAELYVAARDVLLDGLDALGAQRDAFVLVGAQAIYLRTGDADLAVAAFTTDADVTVDPHKLTDEPHLEDVLTGAGFAADDQQPGIWITRRIVEGRSVEIGFDILVAESLGGAGRRAARIPPHSKRVARKAKGLEAALVDNAPMQVRSLGDDERSAEVRVAGPAALLVAKLHKLGERLDKVAEREKNPNRLNPKDAYDILRLLRGVSMDELKSTWRALLENPVSAQVTKEGEAYLQRHFSTPNAEGAALAAEAAQGLDDEDTIRQSCAALASELLKRDQEAGGRS